MIRHFNQGSAEHGRGDMMCFVDYQRSKFQAFRIVIAGSNRLNGAYNEILVKRVADVLLYDPDLRRTGAEFLEPVLPLSHQESSVAQNRCFRAEVLCA